ncbi:hypothetical protein [Archangium sp.]
MRSGVGHALGDPGQLHAAPAQFLRPPWRGHLEINLDGLLSGA